MTFQYITKQKLSSSTSATSGGKKKSLRHFLISSILKLWIIPASSPIVIKLQTLDHSCIFPSVCHSNASSWAVGHEHNDQIKKRKVDSISNNLPSNFKLYNGPTTFQYTVKQKLSFSAFTSGALKTLPHRCSP